MCFIDGYLDGQTDLERKCNIWKSNASKNAWTIEDGCIKLYYGVFCNTQMPAVLECIFFFSFQANDFKYMYFDEMYQCNTKINKYVFIVINLVTFYW